ncbi:MAG: zf-HC2 domain-containing protein [Nitrospinota bacterium]
MDEIDKKIKHIWNKIRKPDASTKREDCPDDKTLSYYIDGVLRETDKERIEQHLLECSNCLDLILLHKKVKENEAHEAVPDVPIGWIERAIDIFPEKEKDAAVSPFDIVFRFAKETIEIIRNPGNLSISYGTVPVPVRGEKKILSTNLVTLSKRFPDVESEVEVEKIGKNNVNIKIITKGVTSGLPLEGLRISLFNPHREIASYVAENGEVHFEDLRFGEYVIKITMLNKKIGQVSLNIKE